MKGTKVISAIAYLFTFALSFSATYAATPANDNFANATLVPVGGTVYQPDNSEATKEVSEPNHALNLGGKSIWYKYVAAENGYLLVSTGGSLVDTTLAIYKGSSLGSLTSIAASDDIIVGGNFQSSVTVATLPGQTYYIAVDGHNSDGSIATGSITVNIIAGLVADNDAFADAITLHPAGGGLSVSNVNATKESGEPNHGGDTGGHSVWYRFVAPAGAARSYTFTTRGSTTQSGVNSVAVLLGVYTGAGVNALTPVASDNGLANVTFIPSPGVPYYIGLDIRSAAQPSNEQGTITLKYGVTSSTESADFDRDGKADIAVFRPGTGTWYAMDSITGSARSVNWGLGSDIPISADLDRDGKTDETVFRPETGTWYSNMSKPPYGMFAFQWGVIGDIPQIYRDGLFDWAAVFRPSDGTWYIKYLNTPIIVKFGLAGDIPVMADYDGDGITDIAVFRPSTGVWYRINSSNGQIAQRQFGVNGDKPVVGDYDNDGRADLAVYRPSTGVWWILKSFTNSAQATQWGLSEDIPQPGDYDGDNRADLAVFRPSSGLWYILKSSSGAARITAFGLPGDKPVTATNFVQ